MGILLREFTNSSGSISVPNSSRETLHQVISTKPVIGVDNIQEGHTSFASSNPSGTNEQHVQFTNDSYEDLTPLPVSCGLETEQPHLTH